MKHEDGKPFEIEGQSVPAVRDPGSGKTDLLKANDVWLSMALSGVNVWAANRILEFIVVRLAAFTPEPVFKQACEDSREFMENPEEYIKRNSPELATIITAIKAASAQSPFPEAPSSAVREKE